MLLLYRVTTRLPGVQQRLESHPVMLIYQGQAIGGRLRHEGVSQAELEEAVRAHGVADLNYVETAVLEMNGMISVISKAAVTPQKLTQVDSRRKA